MSVSRLGVAVLMICVHTALGNVCTGKKDGKENLDLEKCAICTYMFLLFTLQGDLVPNPDDCTTFFSCTTLGPVLQYCNPGLHFSASLSVCDYPDLAGCRDDEAAGIPCPGEDDPSKLIFYPSQRNCGWYYLCLGGKAQKLECGPGLHWNQAELKCDMPQKANCQVDYLFFQPERS